MNNVRVSDLNSPGWILFVKASFFSSVLAMVAGIVFFPGELAMKGFLAMGTLYLIGSTFTLSKTIRDEFENQKLLNRIADARTEQMIKQYETTEVE